MFIGVAEVSLFYFGSQNFPKATESRPNGRISKFTRETIFKPFPFGTGRSWILQCVPLIRSRMVETHCIDKARNPTTYCRNILGARYSAFIAHIDKVLRAMFPWPVHPAAVANSNIRSLEGFRTEVLCGSTLRSSRLGPCSPKRISCKKEHKVGLS